MALTGVVLLLLRSSHPLSGATTLIVSLGLPRAPWEMAMLMTGVLLLTVVGWAINRTLGAPMLVWSARS